MARDIAPRGHGKIGAFAIDSAGKGCAAVGERPPSPVGAGALGLFAMSSYYMQQEIRSVSVKKVFGADYSGVLKELVLSFMKMVGIAFVIGVPIAWFIMNRWLSGYGHRIDLHWWIFVLAGLAVAFIAAISVLYQSIKTARTNPAEALKKE